MYTILELREIVLDNEKGWFQNHTNLCKKGVMFLWESVVFIRDN